MKKLLLIVITVPICILSYAQIENGCLKIELRHAGCAYTLDTRKNDFYPEDRSDFCARSAGYGSLVKNDDELIVEEIMGEPLVGADLRYDGKCPEDFCSLLASVIYESLPDSGECNFNFKINFDICQNGLCDNMEISRAGSDALTNHLENVITGQLKESRWKPEQHYWKAYTSPMELNIKSEGFFKGKSIVIVDYSDFWYEELREKLFLEGPDYEWCYGIPEYQIAPDVLLDTKAHLEDCSIDLSQWIKANVQDAIEIKGFDDCETTVALVISAKGWVQHASVIKTDNEILGDHLRYEIYNSPKWTPATINGENVPSRVIVNYLWRF